MFQKLKGKKASIQMGSASLVTDRLEGKVLDVGESWIDSTEKRSFDIKNPISFVE